MSAFNEFPIKRESLAESLETAKQESREHGAFFIYIFGNTSGMYVIDHIGLPHSDEHVIATFKNGEKVL